MVIATEGRKGGLLATRRNAKEGEIGRDFMLVIEREQANRAHLSDTGHISASTSASSPINNEPRVHKDNRPATQLRNYSVVPPRSSSTSSGVGSRMKNKRDLTFSRTNGI